MMTVIGPQDPVNESDVLTITFSYGSLLPEFFLSETGVREAVTMAGYNVLYVDVDSLIGFRKIVVRLKPKASTEAGVIGKELETRIREYFTSVWGVSADKYEIGSDRPVFTPSGALSLVSLAVLALVGVGIFIYFGGLRK